MTGESRNQDRPGLSAAALSEWSGHVESVLRGIAHALNNRAAALSATIELSRDPSEDAAVISSILGTELERMGDLVAALRSISSPKGGGTEAFAPADAAAEALAVLRLHAEQRDRRAAIEAEGAPPVRVPRWMFVRALIVLGANAARNAETKVVVAEESDWLVTRTVGGGAGSAAVVSPYVSELAHAMGGEPLPRSEGHGFRVPTLAALRRREGREG